MLRLFLRATLIKDAWTSLSSTSFSRCSSVSHSRPGWAEALGRHDPGDMKMIADAPCSMAANLRKQMECLMNGKPLSRESWSSSPRWSGLNTDDLRYQN
jgi:hypothetical protein